MKAVWWLAPAMLLPASGCGQSAPASRAPSATEQHGAARAGTPLTAAPSEDYRRCVTAAGPVDPAQAACAEAEIERVQAALSARWRGAGLDPAAIDKAQHAFETALPLLAPAHATGGTLDRRLAIAHAMRIAAARAHLLTGGAPIAAGRPTPLMGAAAVAWSSSRTSACALAAVDDCNRRYDALRTMKEDSPMSEPSPTSALEGLPLPSCGDVAREGASGATLADAFDRRYPKPLNDEQKIEQLPLDAGQIDNIVGYLACVAGRTDGDVGVAESGLTLFASKRHGAAALAALDRLAGGGGAEAAAAHDYAAQIRGYLSR